MAVVNANINVVANTQQAMAQFKALQAQVAATNKSIGATSGTALAQQAALNKGLMDGANASRMWQARIVPMNTAVQQFSTALDKGRMSLGQYTRFAASQLPGMSRVFKREFEMMNRVATRNVRQMQTQYLELGRSATGAAQAMAMTPTALNKHASAAAVAAQRQMMMNRMIDLGTTKLLNWGKNTQWAGRQLMVGFSIPLAMVGAVAAKAFKEIDKGSIAFRRVYGDLSTTTAEMERNLDAVKALGNEYTKYGLKLADTIELAADVAATGAKNESLMAATEQTLRLATLGLMEYGEALEATVALQTAFQVSNEDLAGTIDFLNVVENETILTMQDMAAAIPRVAPVVKGLGGDVKDLAVFMTAMREGGVTAEQGANALKSGLGRLINPTKAAREVMAGFGMSIDAIIQSNKGDLMGMMQDFGDALATLGDFEQQQVLEKVFGKYQYARLGALFKNLANDASQANRTIELTNMSMSDLAKISERELSKIEEATSTKFQASIERMKVAIAPIGETFMKALMPIINTVTDLLDRFNNLPDGVKNAIAIVVGVIGGLGPIILMTIGLIANGIANLGKLVQTMRKFFARLRGDASLFNYLTQEEREAASAANSLSGATDQLTGKFLGQRKALESLIATVGRYQAALAASAAAAPLAFGMGTARTGGRTIVTGPQSRTTVARTGYAKGVVKVPGSGNKDTVPAMLTPGESVITKTATQKYAPILSAMNAGTLPGFSNGVVGYTSRVFPQNPTQNRAQGVVVPTGVQLGAGMAAGFARGFSKTARQEEKVAEAVYKRLIAITNQFSNNWEREVNDLRIATEKSEISEEELEQARRKAAETTKRQIAQEEKASGKRVLSGPLRTHAFQQMGIPGYTAPITTLSRVGAGHADPLGRAPLMGVQTLRAAGANPTVRERLRVSYKGYGENLRRWAGQKAGIARPDWGHFGPKTNLPLGAASAMASAPGASATAPKVVAAVRSQVVPAMSQIGIEGGSAFGINLVKAAESTSKDIVKKVLAASGHKSPAALMPKTGAEDGTAYGNSWNQSVKKAIMTGSGKILPPGGPVPPKAPPGAAGGGGDAARNAAATKAAILGQQALSPAQQQIAALKKASSEFTTSMKNAFSAMRMGITDAAKPFIKPMATMAHKAASTMIDGFTRASKRIKSSYETAALKTMLALDSVKTLPNKVKSAVTQTRGRLMNMFQTMVPENAGRRIANRAFYRGQDLLGRARQFAGVAMNPVPRAIAMDAVRQRGMEKFDSIVSSATKRLQGFASTASKAGQIIMNPVPRAIAMAAVMDKTVKPALRTMGNAVDGVKSKLSAFGAAVSRGAQIIANPVPRAIALTAIKDKITQAGQEIYNAAKVKFTEAFNKGKLVLNQGFEKLKSVMQTSVQSVKTVFDKAKSSFQTSFNNLKSGISLAAGEMKKASKAAGRMVVESGKLLGIAIKGAASTVAASASGFFGKVNERTGQTRGQAIGGAANTAMMGLMGLSMAASFAGGELGEMAQKIMPVTMGLMGIQMLAPMLKSPFGVAALAATALAGAFIKARMDIDKAAREASDLGANIGGVANQLQIISEATGIEIMTPEDRLFRFSQEDREAMSEFSSFFEGERGSKFIEDLKKMSDEDRYKNVAKMLTTAIANGLSPEKAKAFGSAIAQATGDYILNSRILADIAAGRIGGGATTLIDMARERMGLAPEIQGGRQLGAATRLGGLARGGGGMNDVQRTRQIGTGIGLVAGGIIGAKVGASIGLAVGSVVPILGNAVGLGIGAAVGGIIGGATGWIGSWLATRDDERKIMEATAEAAQGLGFALQMIQDLANAEAVLAEERRQGKIAIEDAEKQQAEIDAMQKEVTDYFVSLFGEGTAIDTDALKQAMKRQLAYQGFSEQQQELIIADLDVNKLAKEYFGSESYKELDQTQRDFIATVYQNTLTGLTPENLEQRMQDVEGTWRNVAQRYIDSIEAGLDPEEAFAKIGIEEWAAGMFPDSAGKSTRSAAEVRQEERNMELVATGEKTLEDLAARKSKVEKELSDWSQQQPSPLGLSQEEIDAEVQTRETELAKINSETERIQGNVDKLKKSLNDIDRTAEQSIATNTLNGIKAVNEALKEAGNSAELTEQEFITVASGFKDQTFLEDLLETEAGAQRLGEAIVALRDYPEIDVELVVRENIDPDEIVVGLEKIKNFKFDKEIFGKNKDEIQRTAMSAEEFVNILNETGQSAGKSGEELEESYGKAMEQFDDLVDTAGKNELGNIKITPDIIPMLFGQDVGNAEQLANQLNDALPDGLGSMQAQIMLSVMADPSSPMAQLFLNNPELLAAVMKGGSGATITRTGVRGGIPYSEDISVAELAAQQGVSPALLDMLQTGSGTGGQLTPGKKPGDRTKSGAGGGKTPLEELEEETLGRLSIYTNMSKVANKYKNAKKSFEKTMAESGYGGSLAAKLRKQNISEMMIANILSKGAKFAQDMLDNIQKTKRLNKQMILGMAGEQISGLVQARRESRAQVKAAGRLRNQNFSSEEISDILSDPAVAETLAGLKVGTKAWEDYIKQLRKSRDAANAAAAALDPVAAALEKVSEAQEEFQEVTDIREAKFQREFGRLDREYRPRIRSQEKIISGLEKQRDAVQSQIDGLEKLNAADERRIRGHQRQIEMLQRQKQAIQDQIDAIERANELDTRRMDSIKRQDELRNRVSSALSRELELMSNAEDKIRKSYDERFKALDKIASVNDYILGQQQEQVGLSKALAEGDIYAATEAAMNMRQSSARFAQDQTRAGLEAGMENQIAGLRTSEGLTREQAEERIRQIQEQSYQTSLRIREIEDAIYERNLQTIPLKDQIREKDILIEGIQRTIQSIQDAIYDRQTQIMDIQVSQLEPINNQIKAEQLKLEQLNDEIQSKKDSYTVDNLTYEQHQDIIDSHKEEWDLIEANIKAAARYGNQVGQVVNQWMAAADAIAEANRLASSLSTNVRRVAAIDIQTLEGDLDVTPAERRAGVAARQAAAQAELDQIEANRRSTIEAARSRATEYQKNVGKKYAGGLVKKYAMGGIVNPMNYTSSEAPPAQKRAAGGMIEGDGGRDLVPAMLTPGEFVIRKAMVKKYGKAMLTDLNLGSFSQPRYDSGGRVETTVASQRYVNNISAPVYNTYDMSFNIQGTNANADEIANRVMMKMRQVQDASIRRNRV